MSPSSRPGEVVDEQAEQRALATAVRSFSHEASRRVDALLDDGSDAPADRLRGQAARVTDAFRERAREELVVAKGDGLLTQQELTEGVEEARQEELDALEEALHAALAGARPPPRRDEFPGGRAYARALAVYVTTERNGPQSWAVLGACMLGSLLLVAGLRALLRRLARGRERIGGWELRRLSETARGPLDVAALAAGTAVGLQAIWLPVEVDAKLALLLELVFGLAALWLAWRASARLGGRIARTMFGARPSGEAADVARKALRLAALLAFLLFVVEGALGIDLTTLLAGLGLVGVAASVAAQDTLRNVIGSVTLHGDRPFLVGDLVLFQDRYGIVEEIGFRSTRIRTLDGPVLVVPNAELVREPVVNLDARRWVRQEVAVQLVYETPPERIEEAVRIVREILEAQEAPPGREPHVIFDGFAAYSLGIRFWYYSHTSDWWEAQHHRSELNLEILRRFNEAGLEFAFPTHTLHVEEGIAGDGPARERGAPERPTQSHGASGRTAEPAERDARAAARRARTEAGGGGGTDADAGGER